MASDLPVPEVSGINLDNYLPCKRTYNSVVYVHKKFFKTSKEEVHAVPECHENNDYPEPKQEHKKKSKNTSSKHNKGTKNEKDFEQTSVNNDEVLGQTIRFAKNIVPIVIPPNVNDTSPVYYSIKTSRKSRVGNKKPKDSAVTMMYKKEQEKKIIETFRREKYKTNTESSQQSTSRSSIENLIISKSLNSSISEISETVNRKTRRIDKGHNKTYVDASESLEALAAEILHTSGEAKIKIHLMDDTAKDLFYESIRKPVIEAIRESVAEIHSKDNVEAKIVHRQVQCHTQKLDNILDKLTCIEKRLDGADERSKTRKVIGKVSALEEIGEDVHEENENDFGRDVTVVYSAADKQKARIASASTRHNYLEKIEELSPNSGGGEIISHMVVTNPSDRPNKIPARYCWTDSTNQ